MYGTYRIDGTIYDGSLRHAQAQRPVSAIKWVLAAHTHGLVWVPLFSRVFPIRTSAYTAAAFQWPV